MIKKTWKCLLKRVILVCQDPFTNLVLNSANIVTFDVSNCNYFRCRVVMVGILGD